MHAPALYECGGWGSQSFALLAIGDMDQHSAVVHSKVSLHLGQDKAILIMAGCGKKLKPSLGSRFFALLKQEPSSVFVF